MLKKGGASKDDQEHRSDGIVGINDGLIKCPLLAVKNNLDQKSKSISS